MSLASPPTYTVTPSAGANGSIDPDTAQTIDEGETTSFTVTSDTGYTASVGGTCGGTLSGTTYTTDAITANCTVSASFTLNTYTVTPSAGANGGISPNINQTISHGATTSFTVTPDSGYTASVDGTCGGTLIGTSYTTDAIVANCTVAATFSSIPINGSCGSAASVATAFPPSANLCAAGTAGGLLPGAPWTWQCAGSGGGSTADCSAPNQTTPVSSGNGRAVISGGTWGVDAAASSGFIPTTGHAKSPPDLPPGISFPHGLLDFTLTGGASGSAATITITYPRAIPAGATYWKYGPSPAGFNCSGAGCAAPHWYEMPAGQAVIAGNTITLTIFDGGVGDDDLTANGTIVDQGGPGVPGAAAIPTLSEWAMFLMSGLMALITFFTLRRRTH